MKQIFYSLQKFKFANWSNFRKLDLVERNCQDMFVVVVYRVFSRLHTMAGGTLSVIKTINGQIPMKRYEKLHLCLRQTELLATAILFAHLF